MAEGEKTIDVTQYPDSFQYVNIVLTDHQGIASTENCALFYADREVVVDSIVLHTDSSTDANDVISIKSFANLGDVDSTGDVIATKTGITQNTVVEMTIDTTKNVVPAGNLIGFDIDETGASLNVLMIQIRLRTRRK
jgi:hypothetical protein